MRVSHRALTLPLPHLQAVPGLQANAMQLRLGCLLWHASAHLGSSGMWTYSTRRGHEQQILLELLHCARSAAIARAMARICNDERAPDGV